MTNSPSQPEAVFSVRPLVRYVDEAQAVLDTHIALRDAGSSGVEAEGLSARPVELRIELTGPDGETFEHRASVDLSGRSGTVRFELAHPARWWPAGMGDQTLYDLSVTLSVGGGVIDVWSATIGLASVRPPLGEAEGGRGSGSRLAGSDRTSGRSAEGWLSRFDGDRPVLLVNGQERAIQSVIPVDPPDERELLPAGGDSLLLVRGHFGSELLYQAADRAGILMLQAFGSEGGEVGSGAGGEGSVLDHVNRLVGHPSLAGWIVLDDAPGAERAARRIRELDPTRSVFVARM